MVHFQRLPGPLHEKVRSLSEISKSLFTLFDYCVSYCITPSIGLFLQAKPDILEGTGDGSSLCLQAQRVSGG